MVRERHDAALEACGPWITAVDEQPLAALDVLGHDRQRTASPAPAVARRHGVYIWRLVEQVGAHVGQVPERRGLIGRDIESAWLATDFVAGKPVGINHTIGRVERRLDEAAQRGWVIVSMKDDSRRVYDADRK